MVSINNPYDSEKYKLTLAMDLIVHLSNFIVSQMKKGDSSEFLAQIIKTWNENIEKNVKNKREEQIKILTTEYNNDTILGSPDVLDILIQIHQIIPNMLKDEFIEALLEKIQTYIIEKKIA